MNFQIYMLEGLKDFYEDTYRKKIDYDNMKMKKC